MHEKTLPKVRKATRPYIDRAREMAWIGEHQAEYAGQWVLLDGDRLIAHGDDPLCFKPIVRAEGIETPFIVHVPKETGPSLYFAEADEFTINVAGRVGFLDRLRVGIIDYDQLLYLGLYDQ